MKKFISVLQLILCALALSAQNYPTPEYVNEVSAWVKDSNRVVRLEKTSSKMENKTKIAGGSEMGYTIDDEKSTIRFRLNGAKYTFLYWTGANASSGTTISPAADSNMRANGVDPAILSNMMGMDPSRMIILYKMESSKGKRKIILAGSGGMFSPGKKKESTKYTCSFKKIREGYYEIMVDKTLPQGEYAFVLAGYGGMGDSIIYSFGID